MKSGRAGKAEIFEYTDEQGNECWLAVEPLRRWAEKNCEICQVPIDIQKIEDMLSKGRIDPEHVQKHTMRQNPRPIIVCEDFREGASEIVDGNHTYVAMAAAFALAEREGFHLPGPPGVPAYVVTREQMEHFLVPTGMRS